MRSWRADSLSSSSLHLSVDVTCRTHRRAQPARHNVMLPLELARQREARHRRDKDFAVGLASGITADCITGTEKDLVH
eukprot:945890-Rhodomonas_salina.1